MHADETAVGRNAENARTVRPVATAVAFTCNYSSGLQPAALVPLSLSFVAGWAVISAPSFSGCGVLIYQCRVHTFAGLGACQFSEVAALRTTPPFFFPLLQSHQ